MGGPINLLGIGFMVGLLSLWELADRVGLIDLVFLPSPWEIIQAAGFLLRSGEFLPNVGHTVGVTLLGWGLASLIGLCIGAALGLWRTVWVYSMSTIELFRALPSIVLLPIAVLVFGFSINMELMLIIFSAQWPVMVSTVDGVRLVPQRLRDTGHTFHLSRLDLIRKIILPAALPRILVGLRLSLALSLILAVAAEMLGNPSGMGDALIKAQEALHADRMFVYFLAIGILGVLLNMVFVLITTRLAAGHSQATPSGGKR